ncbi:MAG: bifunctional uroporphyrinogen-III C-methyltransferase/uroporphyrinogen-III synthase [Sporichthyaceae bacterium]|nr:bifunctional uroporphyrinogen-III C-methyltransferase/uroporphyrinogen-III synthase [Sporichthyaceae bacterium]
MSPRTMKKKPLGSVALVGAGPGDPELLTVRAVELLRSADVVVLDQQACGSWVSRYVEPDTELIEAAQGQGGEPLAHATRAKLLVEAARQGKRVVRLYAGDPALDGSLVEDAAACAKARIPFEIVPGVPSLTAVPEYAGVPLTSRSVHDVSIVDAANGPHWDRHVDPNVTLVIANAIGSIGEIAKALIAAGRKPSTPVLLTAGGTTTEQRTVASTLELVAAAVRAAKLTGPVVTVVGEVVKHRDALSWYETKPLFGWRVLVPRTKEQAGALSEQLRGYGAVPEEVPTISVEPPRTPQQMERGIKGLVTGRYEWVAFTSVNAVKAVRERFEEYGLDARAFAGIKVAVVGEATAAAIRDFGIKPDLMPAGEQSAAGLLEDFPPFDSVFDPINRVFLPRADIATETLVAGLIDLGWEVDDVTAYRTVRATPPPAPTREAIKGGGFDAVVFTSSSTVRNLVGIAGKPHASTVIACIGPQTAKTAEEHGLRVDVLAAEPSVSAVAEALAEYGAARRLALTEAGEPVTRPSERRPAARRKAK